MPPPSSWSSIRRRLFAWRCATQKVGGIKAVWSALDARMVDDAPVYSEALQTILASMHDAASTGRPCLKDAFGDLDSVVAVATSVCVPDVMSSGTGLRRHVAAALRTLVERRKALVCQ